MKNAILVNLILLVSLTASCVNDKVISSSLNTAEALMQTRPDSALQLLRLLDGQHISRGALRARYALLYTQALDKNHLPLSGDSLINTAIDYYSRKKDYRRLSWAYLYKGNAYVYMDSLKLALSMYKKAQDMVDIYVDDELLTLVANEMGVLYQGQGHYKEALEFFQISLAAGRKNGNLQHENYVLGRIGNVFYLSALADSAESYYRQAKALALFRQDTVYSYLMEMNLSKLLREKKQYSGAIAALTRTVRQMQEQQINSIEYYPLLGMLYLDVGQIDSARHYMYLVLRDTQATSGQRAGALAGMKRVEEQAGDYEAAINYMAKYKELSDSIRREHYLHDFRIVKEKHQQEKLKKEQVKQKTKHMGTVAGICTLSVTAMVMTVYWWKRRMTRWDRVHTETLEQQDKSLQELRRSYCINQWNTTLFLKEFNINFPYPPEEVFYAKVFKAAHLAYPGMIDWLKKRYPQLNTADIIFTCLLYADLGPKDLCGLYKLSNPDPLYTRRSRLYQKLGIKVGQKRPFLFRDGLVDLYVRDTM
ncbi:MAG: tetratricopeptide repeat protein [Bacteroidales bacterium]|nr:tetratricopeptide repeat protein [Bacteroidales bacterium]